MNKEEARAMLERVAQSRQKADVVVGIDPDIDNSGLCIISPKEKSVSISSVSINELMYILKGMEVSMKEKGEKIRIFVEAGWKNESNWHINTSFSKKVCVEIGRRTGLNHATAKIIAEIARSFFNLDVIEIRPLKKCWKGKDGKITHEELNYQLKLYGFKPLKRTNQDIRDSVLLALLNI